MWWLEKAQVGQSKLYLLILKSTVESIHMYSKKANQSFVVAQNLTFAQEINNFKWMGFDEYQEFIFFLSLWRGHNPNGLCIHWDLENTCSWLQRKDCFIGFFQAFIRSSASIVTLILLLYHNRCKISHAGMPPMGTVCCLAPGAQQFASGLLGSRGLDTTDLNSPLCLSHVHLTQHHLPLLAQTWEAPVYPKWQSGKDFLLLHCWVLSRNDSEPKLAALDGFTPPQPLAGQQITAQTRASPSTGSPTPNRDDHTELRVLGGSFPKGHL